MTPERRNECLEIQSVTGIPVVTKHRPWLAASFPGGWWPLAAIRYYEYSHDRLCRITLKEYGDILRWIMEWRPWVWDRLIHYGVLVCGFVWAWKFAYLGLILFLFTTVPARYKRRVISRIHLTQSLQLSLPQRKHYCLILCYTLLYYTTTPLSLLLYLIHHAYQAQQRLQHHPRQQWQYRPSRRHAGYAHFS